MSFPVFYVKPGDTLPIPFSSYDGATGASEAASGLAVTDIEIYKDGGTTQRASDNGYTLLDTDGLDFDGITGINGFSVDFSDNSDAGFYAEEAWYWVVVSSVTVDTQTVNFIAAAVWIQSTTRGMAGTALPAAPANAAGGVPISDAGGLDLDTLLGYLTAAVATATELAKVPKSDGTSVWNATAAAQIQSEANDALVAYDPPTNAEMEARTLVAASYATASKQTDIETDTQDLQTQIGTAGAGLTGLGGMSATMKGQVNAEVVDCLNTDTYAEPGQETPGATVSIVKKIGYLYKGWRNKKDQTSTLKQLYNDDATTVDQKCTVSDDGTTYAETEMATGP